MGLFDDEMGREAVKKHKKLFRKLFNQKPAPEVLPLTEKPRCGNYEDEYYSEYGFLPQNTAAWSDDEIREYIDEYIRIPSWWSPYDCTGKPLTCWIDWHRNPCGLVSYVHRIGLDV